MLLTLSLLLLASAPDAGTPPPPSTNETVAIIWGGGKDAAAAQEALRRWEAEKKLLGGALTFTDGFPKRVASASVPGLNPGFEIVLLGFCGGADAASARRFLKALYPFVYERPVKVDAPACPKWAGAHQGFTVEPPATVKAKDVTLTVASAWLKGLDEASITDQISTGWVRVVARDKANTLLDVFALEDTQMGTGMRPVGCETSVAVRKSAVVLERTCTEPAMAACNFDPGEKTRTTVRWDGQKLATDQKTLKTWTVDYNTDCAG
jgi:hypothetical protein